jgi:hypothetical protein
MIKVGTTQVVKRNANNSELQAAIEAVIPQAVAQTKDIAGRYKGKTETETCKKIFDYLKNQVRYKADGAEQQVRLPSGLIRTLQGDCKSYAVFTSAILNNLKIPHSLVYTSYDEKDPTPTHIYVVTDKGCIIDAVYGKFNAEKKPTYKKLKPMNISYIAGVKSRRKRIGSMGKYGTGGACGIGAVETGLEWGKRNGIFPYQSEAWLFANNGTYRKYAIAKTNPLFITGRQIFRLILEKNGGGIASSINKAMVASRSERQGQPNWDKMRKLEIMWLENGGNPNELYESISTGATKTPTGAYFNKLMLMKAGGYNPNPAQWIAAVVSLLFGKKYNEATGKITGSSTGIGLDPATDAGAVTSATVWAGMVGTVITTLGLALINKGSHPTPDELNQNNNNNNGGSGDGSGAGTGSALLPILLVGGAAAAYFILKDKK